MLTGGVRLYSLIAADGAIIRVRATDQGRSVCEFLAREEPRCHCRLQVLSTAAQQKQTNGKQILLFSDIWNLKVHFSSDKVSRKLAVVGDFDSRSLALAKSVLFVYLFLSLPSRQQQGYRQQLP